MRHKWKHVITDFGHTTKECVNCNLRKIERHSGSYHWNEWFKDGEYISSSTVPKCTKEN